MRTDHPLPDPLVELIAQRFRVIGEPMRIKLLDRLRDGSATVGELVAATGATQQNVSKHLGVLHQAAIVRRSKEGKNVRYEIADESVFELCEMVCGGLRRQLDALSSIAVDSDRCARRSPCPVSARRAPRALDGHARLASWSSPGCCSRSALGSLAPRAEHALSGAGWEATGSESVEAREAIDRRFAGQGSYALQVVVSSDPRRSTTPAFACGGRARRRAAGGTNPDVAGRGGAATGRLGLL